MRARCKAAPGAYFLSSQCRDQFQKAVDNGLVEQVDEQGLAAAPAEKAERKAQDDAERSTRPLSVRVEITKKIRKRRALSAQTGPGTNFRP